MTGRGERLAIIGGGLSGMAAALVLARHGRRVTIVEKRSYLGATLRGFSRQGVHFDTGLHYAGALQPGGALARYFRLLGIEDLPLRDFSETCFDRVRILDHDLEVCLPVGLEPLIETLSGHFPCEADFIRAFFLKIRDAYSCSDFLSFGNDFKELMNKALHQESLASVLEKGTRDPALRAVLSVHSLLYGVSPKETPFLQHARIVGSYLEGVKTMAGGGKTLAEALEGLLQRAGVEVCCKSAVRALEFSGAGSVSGVLLEDGRRLAADGVVFTAHPALLPPMLPPGAVKPAFAHRLSALEDTSSAYVLFGRSLKPIPAVRGGKLFVCRTPDVAQGFAPDCLPEAGPFYIPGCADMPEENTAWGIMAFAPGSAGECLPYAHTGSGRRSPEYKAFKEQRLEGLRRTLCELVPELRDVEYIDGGTPLTNRDFLGSPGCGLYGAKHSLVQFSPLPATRVPNLWMAGQSVIAPGVLGAIISAYVACSFILGVDTIRGEIAACA